MEMRYLSLLQQISRLTCQQLFSSMEIRHEVQDQIFLRVLYKWGNLVKILVVQALLVQKNETRECALMNILLKLSNRTILHFASPVIAGLFLSTFNDLKKVKLHY